MEKDRKTTIRRPSELTDWIFLGMSLNLRDLLFSAHLAMAPRHSAERFARQRRGYESIDILIESLSESDRLRAQLAWSEYEAALSQKETDEENR